MKTLLIFLGLLTVSISFPQDREFITSKDYISFKADIRPVFKNRCIQCHSARSSLPNIIEYDVAKSLKYEIKEKVSTRKMPYFGQMTESERELIINWVNQGAKE